MRLTDVVYAYRKLRSWHVAFPVACVRALRYALTGDSGRVRSHGGWRRSRLRSAHRYDDN